MTASTRSATYFGLQADFADQDKARAVILPVPYQSGEKHGRNPKDAAKLAPKAVLEASRDMELFDDELWVEPYKIGIHSASALEIASADEKSEAPFDELTTALSPILAKEKFPIVVGGERPLSLGTLNACRARYDDVSVLMLGANADLCSEPGGNPYAPQATGYALYSALEKPAGEKPSVVQVGVRGVSWQEVAWMEEEQPAINIFWARTQAKWDLNEIVGSLSDNVVLSLDMSVLDPAFMPAVASPEPGGLTWYQLLDLLRLLCVRKNVIAADITGLMPLKSMSAPDYLTAKLIYKLIGYRFALDLGVSKKYL